MSKLTKEECIISLKELSRIRCIVQEEYDREEHAIIMLEHLINEHFELKEKVDSIQSLLGEVDMFELLKAIIDYDKVNGNPPCFPIKDKFRIITDKDYDKLSPLLDNNPYEFEELEDEVEYYDNLHKRHVLISFASRGEKHAYSCGFHIPEVITKSNFKTNRFYPREVKDNG